LARGLLGIEGRNCLPLTISSSIATKSVLVCRSSIELDLLLISLGLELPISTTKHWKSPLMVWLVVARAKIGLNMQKQQLRLIPESRWEWKKFNLKQLVLSHRMVAKASQSTKWTGKRYIEPTQEKSCLKFTKAIQAKACNAP